MSNNDASTPAALQGTPADPTFEPAVEPVSEETLAVPEEGLEPREQSSKRVVIIGGGIAGLVAAFELRRQGHEPLVLEAQHRVGGRVKTIRDFAPGLYAEAGAMRIPRVHDLTLAYCELFGLEMRPFVMGNPKTLVFIDGKRMTIAEADANPDKLPFDLADHEKGKTWTQLWNEATSEFRQHYEKGGQGSLDSLAQGIRPVLDPRVPDDARLQRGRARAVRRDELPRGEHERGRGRAAARDRRPRVRGHAGDRRRHGPAASGVLRAAQAVRPLRRRGDGDRAEPRLGDGALQGRRRPFQRPRRLRDLRHPVQRPARHRDPQHAVLAREAEGDPRAQLQRVDQDPLPDAAPLLGAEDGIVGGTTVTDLPIRRICYPSFSDPDDERGTLLASYTWGQDALRWGAMDAETMIEQALEDVAQVHPSITTEFEVGAVQDWYGDPWARGAFALFEPEQQTRLQAAIVAARGPHPLRR